MIEQTSEHAQTARNTRYRTLARRIGSGTVDSALIVLPLLFLVPILAFAKVPGKYLILNLVSQALAVTYNVVFVSLTNSTPGKKLFGMRIARVDDEDADVGLRAAVLREVLNSVGLILTLMLAIIYAVQGRWSESDLIVKKQAGDVLWDIVTSVGVVIVYSEIATALFNRKRRAVHDFIARTVVVKGKIESKLWAAAFVIIALGAWGVLLQVEQLLKG